MRLTASPVVVPPPTKKPAPQVPRKKPSYPPVRREDDLPVRKPAKTPIPSPGCSA